MKRRQAIRNTLLVAGSSTLTPTLLSLLQSCESRPRLNWKPVFFNDNQAQLVSVLADTWLPKTGTPGALDMKVDIFMDLVVSQLYDNEAQAEVIAYIDALNQKCQRLYEQSFVDLSEDVRTEVMKIEEAESGKFNRGVWGTTIGEQRPVGTYRKLKSLALWGYFTSEEIGKHVLDYDPVPGEYLGCIDLKKTGSKEEN